MCRQLSEIVIALEKPLEEKEIEFSAEMDDRLMLRTDPGMLELAWHNLLSNAVKFTPPGGKITLTQTSSEDSVSVSISDTGCGMDEEGFSVSLKATPMKFVNSKCPKLSEQPPLPTS